MKEKLIISLLFTVLSTVSSGQSVAKKEKQGFVITGKAPYLESERIILAYMTGNQVLYDTTWVKEGKFRFKGTLPGPARSTIYAGGQDQLHPYTFFHNQFIENSRMSITREEANGPIVFTGSAFNDAFESLEKQLKPLSSQFDLLKAEGEELMKKDTIVAMSKMKQAKQAYEHYIQSIKAYIKKHPESEISLMKLTEISAETDVKVLRELLSLLSLRLKDSPGGMGLLSQIKSRETNFIGQEAFNFTQKDQLGKDISLVSFRGKYVLLDFWASWCGPCRAENPNLRKAYNKYKSRGLEVVAVSLDNSRDKWQEAIIKDSLPWIQVSDLKGWKNKVGFMYHIYSIPTNFLIDPDGKIVAMNLTGKLLEGKLEELLVNE